MKKRKLPKPTPRGLPPLKELDKLMTGLDLGEWTPPSEVVGAAARGRPHPLPIRGSMHLG